MKKSKFSLTHKDEEMLELVSKTDQKALAIWAIDCAKHVQIFFEEQCSQDHRSRKAIGTLQEWLSTGVRWQSFARLHLMLMLPLVKGEKIVPPVLLRAAGQAVTTAHVKTHSYGPEIYAQQAIYRANNLSDADAAVIREPRLAISPCT